MRANLMTLLVVVVWLQPASAEEETTFCGKTVGGWIGVLRDSKSSKSERRQAVWALGCFGTAAKAATPDLIGLLHDKELDGAAIEALVRMEAGDGSTVPILIERFRKEGCERLTGMGSIGGTLRVNLLVKIGAPAVPALVGVLNGPDADMRVCAAEALGEIGPAARGAVPALIGAIEHARDDYLGGILSRHAVQALGRIGPDARAAVPLLVTLLDKEELNYRTEVVLALDGIGVPPIRPLLDALLRGEEPGEGFYNLCWLGPEAREAVPALRGALTDKRLQIRIYAATLLAQIDGSAVDAIPVLIEALDHCDDRDLDVFGVPEALAQFGSGAKSAIPMLLYRLKKDPKDTAILMALARIDSEGKFSVPALVSALQEDDASVVKAAADCVSLVGPLAKDAVPALMTVLVRDLNGEEPEREDALVSVANAIRRMERDGLQAIPALIEALEYGKAIRPPGIGADVLWGDHGSSIAEAAAEVLGSFGAEARAAVPSLIELVYARRKYDVAIEVVQAAILALGRIGPDATPATPALRSLLEDNATNSFYQPEAVIALLRLAPDGRDVAEKWLTKPSNPSRRDMPFSRGEVADRAMVLGALGRASFETDWVTRGALERLDLMIGFPDPRENPITSLEWWFVHLSRFGAAARAAIPRLREYSEHRDPWVRMWAREALTRITPPVPRKGGGEHGVDADCRSR